MTKLRFIPLVATLFVLSGCGLVYSPTGAVLTHYAQDEVLPYTLASGDLNKAACGLGKGMALFIGSFSRVVERPAMNMISVNTLAALCAETKAQRAHLHMLAALRHGRTEEAQDARIWSMRLQRRTALRRYQVYRDTVVAFGTIGDGQCPALEGYMGSDRIELQFLIGLLTSVQGLLNDIKAGSTVGIPQNIARKVARGTECLNSRQWWGVPEALQAVVWISVPGSTPEGVDPWAQLARAADYGASQGMALAPLLYTIAAKSVGNMAKVKQGIRQIVQTYNSGHVPQQYLLLSQVAYSQAQFLSDVIWTKKTGHRTPIMAMGTFPGEDTQKLENFDVSDYL